ncbi:MAG: [FeFe] hydrogenase H-cluster maturation GTPase HydF [Bacteroidetes bacterium]|nr:[FeFe] hydrogenase H-cluster maturation GTPase HydF [Bacteroidota bacterium]MCL2302008.1 [FeFe] hydrogenase H-cluster maturation GTPase HydF [Lentimicrobiaceae bacterium]
MKGYHSQPHIGIFGRRNNGKSALINALTGQEIAIVSDVAGTTTDPVKKSMEISGIGPVVLIDTAGIDDVNELGKKRVEKTENVLKHIDLAILVLTNYRFDETEKKLLDKLRALDTPFIIVNNKSDIINIEDVIIENETVVSLSAKTGKGISALIEEIKHKIPVSAYHTHSLLEGIVKENDTVLLITPIDSEAPEGRLILPQVQTIRAILDQNAVAVVMKPNNVRVENFRPIQPNLVITDSQVFKTVAPLIPLHIPLTSFSILFARLKGDYDNYLKGTPQIENLKDGDSVLILESCTHLSSCEDIGKVKIPKWLTEYTGKTLHFDFISGLTPVENIEKYALVVQCGGCMITKKQILNRLKPAVDAGIPVTNYGMLIAYVTGIFERATGILQSN